MPKGWFSLLLFLVILTLASFLRLYRLSSVPPGVNRDEASIGFTAYSLLLTGKDEYGRFLPLSFQSFGDWKLPLYIYLTVPMVKIFGLSEIAVRLTSALTGILTVGLTFFLARLLFKNTPLALLSMMVIAIAPWHLHLSRVESESNLAVFLTTVGILLFFKAQKQPWLYLLSFVLLSLTYYAYAGNHIFTTLLVIGLVIIFRQTVMNQKLVKIGLVIFAVLAGLILSQTLAVADKTKISGIGIFSSPNVVYQNIELPRGEHSLQDSLTARIFHNRFIYATKTIAQNYIKSFSPEFLVIRGGTNHAHNIAGFGNMYLVEFPFLILGFCFLLTRIKDPKVKLVLWWFMVSPVAASLTKDAPHTNRMFAIFPVLPIVVSFGIYWIVDKLREKKPTLIAVATLITVLYLVNFGIYFDRYYVHFPKNEARYWGIWYQELTKILTSDKFKNQPVLISHPEQSPYIYLLFYSGYHPALYQRQAVRFPPTEDGFYHVKSFDRFEFGALDWSRDTTRRKGLLVDFLGDIPAPYRNRVTEVGGLGIYNVQ